VRDKTRAVCLKIFWHQAGEVRIRSGQIVRWNIKLPLAGWFCFVKIKNPPHTIAKRESVGQSEKAEMPGRAGVE